MTNIHQYLTSPLLEAIDNDSYLKRNPYWCFIHPDCDLSFGTIVLTPQGRYLAYVFNAKDVGQQYNPKDAFVGEYDRYNSAVIGIMARLRRLGSQEKAQLLQDLEKSNEEAIL